MSSSPMVSLFSERPELNQQPYSFAFSILAHSAAIGLILLGIVTAPKVRDLTIAERYAVRHLDLHTPEPQQQRATRSGIHAPRPQDKLHTPSPGGSTVAQQQTAPQLAQSARARQTLVQPDLPKPVKLPVDTPVPSVVLWNGAKSPAKTLIAPQHEMQVISEVLPSLQTPNEEKILANIALASKNLPIPQPLTASTTTPVAVHGEKPTPPAPVTSAKGSAQATPTAVLSLNNLAMADGSVTLAPVNESAAANSSTSLSPGKAQDLSQSGHGSQAGKSSGIGSGAGSGSAGAPSNSGGSDQGNQDGAGRGYLPTITHIALPKDGQFGAVVVGSSLEEKFPEMAQMWSGRLAYTVYLHMGLARSWILQYSLPRDDDASAAGGTHLEAPWPFTMVRPNIAPDSINADALMIHGYVNQAGRFEGLAVAFPPEFPQAQFVMNALSQWKFRPATQNGHEIRVEVLLIIPEENN